MNRVGLLASSLLLVLALLSSTLFVVDQRQFGVVYALGQIKEVVLEPGLNFKLPPPFQNVTYIDRRLLTLESTDSEPMLTLEKQRVVIDWYVRWRITDPSEYIRNVGLDEKAGANQLNRVVRNAFQEEINRRTVKDLLSLKREQLMADVKKEVLSVVRGAKPWGIDVNDVRITRVDYVEAAAIFAQSFGKDAQFAQFYRSLDAYKASFNKKGDVMVVDPSSEFFKSMRGSGSAGSASSSAKK